LYPAGGRWPADDHFHHGGSGVTKQGSKMYSNQGTGWARLEGVRERDERRGRKKVHEKSQLTVSRGCPKNFTKREKKKNFLRSIGKIPRGNWNRGHMSFSREKSQVRVYTGDIFTEWQGLILSREGSIYFCWGGEVLSGWVSFFDITKVFSGGDSGQ